MADLVKFNKENKEYAEGPISINITAYYGGNETQSWNFDITLVQLTAILNECEAYNADTTS